MTYWFSLVQARSFFTACFLLWVCSAAAGAQDFYSGYCQLAPITDTRVGFAGREIVNEVAVDLGQQVAHGDVLVRLDPAGLPARLDRARAELRQAERAMERADALAGVLVAEERDRRETDLAVRQAQMREIELEIQRLTLRAPHDGIVVEIMAREGELLEDSVAVRIVDLNRLLIEADLPLARLSTLEQGQIINLSTATGGAAEASIIFVDPLVDLASRSFRILAELDNHDQRHIPGTTCNLVD